MTAFRSCLLCLMLVLFSACGVPDALSQFEPADAFAESPPEQPGTQRAGQAADKDPDSTVALGFGYRPTDDGTSPAQLARDVGLIVLSKNDEAFRDELRAEGYGGLILQYILAAEIDGPKPAKSCDRSFEPWQNQAINDPGEFCGVVDKNEDWFLHNGDGERLYDTYKGRYYYRMNPANEGWRAYMLERLKRHLFGDDANPPLGYDGFFFDNVELTMVKSRFGLENSDGTIREFKDTGEFRAAWRGWIKAMRDGLGTDVPLWANMVAGTHAPDEWNSYLTNLDGAMAEDFVTGYSSALGREKQNNDLAQAEYALAQGKGLFAISQGDKDDEEKQQFALASFLLIAEPGKPAYFRYTRANTGDYTRWWLYDNYNVQLGAPLGPRSKIQGGWRRDFERGYVVVNQVEHSGKIVETDPKS